MKKQFKLLLILLTTFITYNAEAQTWYAIGTGTRTASSTATWYSNSTGTGGTAITGIMNTNFANTSYEFDLNGKTVNFNGIILNATKLKNGTGTAAKLTIAASGTLRITNNPTIVAGSGTIDFDFSSNSNTTVIYQGVSGTQTIIPATYKNLTLTTTSGGQKIISASNTVTIENTLNISAGLIIEGTLALGANMQFSSMGTADIFFQSGGAISDLRSSKIFPHNGFVNTNSSQPLGTFKNLYVYNDITLSSNIEVTGVLVIGNSVAEYLLDISSYTLTLSNTPNMQSSGTTTDVSRIDASNGTLKITSPSGSSFTFYNDHYGTAKTSASTANILNLTLDCSVNPLFVEDLTIDGNLTLDQGSLEILDCIVTVQGNTIVNNTVANLAIPEPTATSYKMDLEGTNSKLTIHTTDVNFQLDPTLFTNATINSLELNFVNGGNLELLGDLTIAKLLDLSQVDNFLDLNGQTLTTKDSISTGTSSPGMFIGGATSSIICGATGTLYFNQSGTDNYLKNFTVNNSKTATIGNTLNITGGTNYGTVIVDDTLATCSTGNNLVLKSDANGSARIGQSSGSIVGEYTVEKYIPADRDYRFISSPVVNGTALQLRDNKGSTSGRGIQITGNNPSATTGNDFDASLLNNPSAYYYAQDTAGDVTTISKIAGATDDPGWRPFWNGNTFKLINGKGYRVFVRGDRSINLNQSGQPDNNTTIWTKGTYPGYSVNIPVQNSGRSKTNNGINLIGNPYPSVIDWNLIGKSNIDSGYMVYKNSNQSYVGWNGVTGSAGQYISAYQGFLVKCTNSSGSGSITVHERTKTVQTGGSFFQQKLTNHLKITLTYDSSYNSDTYLHFRNDAKNTYDGNDIQQMLNNGTNVATLDDAGMPYNINSMGTLDSFKSIPLSVEGTPAADLKLSFYDVASFSTHKLELIDNYLKKTTPIVEAMDYAFSITNDSWSYKNGRFFINLTKQETASNKIVQTEKLGILHPNPVKDKINIRLEKNATNGKYQIVNSIGQEIMSGDIVGKSKTIDAKNLSTGIYYLNILSNGTSQNIKFIK